MNRYKMVLTGMALSCMLACGEDKPESVSDAGPETLSHQEGGVGTDSLPVQIQDPVVPSAAQSGSRKLSRIELERIIDDIGFQLEELKGKEAGLEAVIRKLSKRKLSESERAQKTQAEKNLGEIQSKIQKTLEKLQRKQEALKGAS
jgi:hypothetical protein